MGEEGGAGAGRGRVKGWGLGMKRGFSTPGEREKSAPVARGKGLD